MKRTINTKYSIGDEFWIMENGIPQKIVIRLIKIQISSLDNLISYACIKPGSPEIIRLFSEPELNNVSKTKEELRKIIFGE